MEAQTKLQPFCRRYFHNRYLDWNLLYRDPFNWNFRGITKTRSNKSRYCAIWDIRPKLIWNSNLAKYRSSITSVSIVQSVWNIDMQYSGYNAACIVYNTAKYFTSVQVQVMFALYQIYAWWNAANITFSEIKLGSARAPTKILSTQNHYHCLLLCRLCYHTDEASYWALWYNVFEVLWSSQDNSFEDRVPVYEPFRYVIFQWFAVTWLKK